MLTYEAAAIVAEWNGLDLSKGWAPDTFLEFAPNSERVTHTVGADSQYTFSKMSDKGATITLTLQQAAPLNRELSKIIAEQDKVGAPLTAGPFSVIDSIAGSANFVVRNAVLTEVPTTTFGAANGERVWVWVCESYFLSDDVAAITAELNLYLNF